MIAALRRAGAPTTVVTAACLGLVSANVARPGAGVCAAVLLAALLAAVAAPDGPTRVVAVAAVAAVAGLWWGTLRLDALGRSILSAHIGERAAARVVVTGPARRGRFSVRLPAEVREFAGVPLRERVLLELPRERAPPQGAVLELEARPVAPRGPETGFDERGWLARGGVHVVLRARAYRLVGRRGGIGGVGDRLRRHVSAALQLGTTGERRALLEGVVLGADGGLDEQTRSAFKASGLSHLLAVSGQNVAFLVWGVLGLAWVVGVPRAAAHVLAVTAIAAYAVAVGWQPSVVRASVAGALASLAWLVARPRDPWHFLAVGALVLLVWSPASVFDPGFQLSFAAVAAIFVAVPRLDALLERLPLPFALPRKLRIALAVSFACGVATSPVLALDFGRVPLWSVLSNALAEPAVGPLLGLGLLAACVAPVSPSAAAALSWLAGWAAAWIAFCARLVARFPGAQLSPGWALGALATVVGTWVALARLPPWRRRRAAAWALAAATLGGSLAWSLSAPSGWTAPPGLRVSFLDVGQGDAILLEVPGGAVLVDTGPPEAHVERMLRRRGLRSLSAVVLTHPHRDHVGGAPGVLGRLAVGALLDPLQPAGGPAERAALQAARRRGVPVVPARQGSSYRTGSLLLRVLWPDGGGRRGEDPHLHGVVLLASYGATDLLLTGDAESRVTSRLSLPPVEVLKVAHHGSEDPGLPELLRRLRPRIAVIEVGAHNDYGHPRAETLAALARAPSLTVFRTDLDGTVVLTSDGRTIAVDAARGVGSSG